MTEFSAPTGSGTHTSTGPLGLFRQITTPGPRVRRLHTALKIALLPRIIDLDRPVRLVRRVTGGRRRRSARLGPLLAFVRDEFGDVVVELRESFVERGEPTAMCPS